MYAKKKKKKEPNVGLYSFSSREEARLFMAFSISEPFGSMVLETWYIYRSRPDISKQDQLRLALG